MPVTSKDELITDVQDLYTILSNNNGIVILKFSADWCGPCKKIGPIVDEWKNILPESVVFYDIDIDESLNLYSYFKTRKMLAGIPSLMCWRSGNSTFVPDYTVNNSDPVQVTAFFRTCEVCVK